MLQKKLKNIIKKILYPNSWLDDFPISVTLKYFIFQRIFRINCNIPFPTHFTSSIDLFENIVINNVNLNNKYIRPFIAQSPGVYIQAINGIEIGNNVYIAPGVKIISADHDFYNLSFHKKSKPIKIGSNVWIGANSIILKEVELGDNTIVAAGTIVTKSFKSGYCIIGGNPARIIKILK